jgi:hypothetical protein
VEEIEAFIIPDDDEHMDPLADRRKEMKLQKGEVPSIVKSNPGMSITTIELPATAKVEHWSNFLHQLQMAEGLVVLRGMGMTFWDNEVYLKQQEMFAELAECVDAREMFIINIAKGDTRSVMMGLLAMSNLSLCTPDATFGFPEARLQMPPSIMACMLEKRVDKDDLERLVKLGHAVDAREAQRVGLVDFVGDCDAELARLIMRNCKPTKQRFMWKPDVARALREEKEMGTWP